MNGCNFLKVCGITGATISGRPSKNLFADTNPQLLGGQMGVLQDTTVCIGCRRYEWACKVALNMPADNVECYRDASVLRRKKRPEIDGYAKVNRCPNAKNPRRPKKVKRQYIHCHKPACVEICPAEALTFSKRRDLIKVEERRIILYADQQDLC